MRRLFGMVVLLAAASGAVAHPGAAIAVAADGRVYFVDTGAGVFSIDRAGRLARQEGAAFHWFAFDPSGRFRNTRWPAVPGAAFQSAGVDPTLILSSDFPVVIGSDGAMYFPQGTREGGVRIVRVTASGAQSLRASLPPLQSGGRPAWWLNGLAAGPDGSLVYTEDRAVRRIDANGRVSDIAANVVVPDCRAIPGIGAEMRPYLRGLAVAPDGAVYVAASGCGAVIKIDRGGKTQTVLKASGAWSPTAVAVANGEIYVLEYLHTASDVRSEWLPRVRKVTRGGAVVALTSR